MLSLIFFIFSSSSRGGVFLIFVQFAAFLAYDFNFKNILNIKYIFKIIIYLFSFIFLFTCLYYFGLFDQIITKFKILTEFKVSNAGIGTLDITNGRTNLAALVIPYIKENLFGIDPYIVNPLGLDAHNNYLNFALKYGFFSSIAFHSLFFYFQFYFYFSKEKNIINLIGFVTNSQLIVYWIFETASVIYPVWIVIIFYTLSRKNYIEKNL